MTNNDYKMILQRLAGLEDQVGRMGQVLAGIEDVIGLAKDLPSTCAKCDKDWRKQNPCLDHDCPCGKN